MDSLPKHTWNVVYIALLSTDLTSIHWVFLSHKNTWHKILIAHTIMSVTFKWNFIPKSDTFL